MNRIKRLFPLLMSLIFCVAILMPAAADDWAHVESLEIEDQVIRGVWASFVERLNEGDAEGALRYHVPENRETVAELYDILGDSLKDLPDNWTELLEPEMYGPYVSYKLMDQSTRLISSVTFLKFPDGQWLIKSM
ncbi:MAG: hypothetical protein QNI99_10395 [Woeseiaceae bacterium]|nr:hypothetical protein [Woeseiaceae bacterium]